jgi:site-specific DNA-methyltransferase (adenine-specific)
LLLTFGLADAMHNIFSFGQMLSVLNFKILNVVTWQKTNPPPSWAKRSLTHSTEQIIWARKNAKLPHFYNYNLMSEIAGKRQLKDVWTLPAIQKWEKTHGKHPTQKPLSILTRLMLASTVPNARILDPFTGASTTGIAANLLGRKFLGIDTEAEFLDLSRSRKIEIENPLARKQFMGKMDGFENYEGNLANLFE